LNKRKRYLERFDKRAIGIHMGENMMSDEPDSAK
jgi:hypothetical protein